MLHRFSSRGRQDAKDALFWDRDLAGFGVRVHATGRKRYVVQSRGPTGLKRVTLGHHGEFATEEARKQAAVVIDRIKRGEVAALHHRLRDTPPTVNAVVRTISTMFHLVEAWERVPPGRNPRRSVRQYEEHARERFLTPEEYRRLGRVLKEAEADGSVWPPAIAAIRLLVLTGCRHSEIVSLRWDNVDRTAGELQFRDAKAGPRMVPLTEPMSAVLAGIRREPGNPRVVVGQKPGTRLSSLRNYWHSIREKAGLDDMRLHDCRHYSGIRLVLGRPGHGYRGLSSLQHVA